MNPYYPAGQEKIDDIPLEDDRGSCDFCQSPITDEEEERFVYAGDESLTLCESCGSHYLD